MERKINSLYSPIFLLPSFTIYLLFFLVPTVIGFFFSFTDWNIHLDKISFIGLENFVSIFTRRVTRLAIKNSLQFAIITTIGKNVLGLVLALLVNSAIKGKNFFRSIFFFPAVLNYIIIGLLFTYILHPSGVLNSLLSQFGFGNVDISWIADRKYVMYSVSAVEIWQWSGFHMAIYLAGLQSIPSSLIESAQLDGANAFQQFSKITFPLIIPSFNVSLVIALISGFKVFDLIYVLTDGGPGYASEVINTQIYKTFGEGRWGYASAMNLLLFIFIAIISLTLLLFLKKKEVEH